MVRSTHVKQGLPDSVFVTLTYGTSTNITAGTGATHLAFSGNSLFIPSLDLATHQPLYFDQYAALYDRYMVYGSSIQATVCNTSAGAQGAAVWPSVTGTGTAANVGEMAEQPYVVLKTVAPAPGSRPVTLFKSMSTSKMRGGTVFSDDWGALVTADPERTWFWNFNVITFGGADSDCSVTFKLRYRCRFYKRTQVDQS